VEATFTEDDIILVCEAMEVDSKEIFQRYGEKHEGIYGRIEKELKEVQQAIRLVSVVPTMLSSTVELKDESTQLRRMVYAIEVRIQRI